MAGGSQKWQAADVVCVEACVGHRITEESVLRGWLETDRYLAGYMCGDPS